MRRAWGPVGPVNQPLFMASARASCGLLSKGPREHAKLGTCPHWAVVGKARRTADRNAAWATLVVYPFNPCCADIFMRKYVYISHHSSTPKHRTLSKFTLKEEDKNYSIAHGQYHHCWWPGDIRSHGISNNGIDLDSPEYFCFCTKNNSCDEMR